MAQEPFIGEIRMFGGNFAPKGWKLCDGSLLPIADNQVLFTLLQTTYGGDGSKTFGLPDLRGRVPLSMGSNGGQVFGLGQAGGAEKVTLTQQELPSHRHPFGATNKGAQLSPAGNNPAVVVVPGTTKGGFNVYGTGTNAPTTLHPQTITPAGGGAPHNNLQPYFCINFIIALQGVYPSPN